MPMALKYKQQYSRKYLIASVFRFGENHGQVPKGRVATFHPEVPRARRPGRAWSGRRACPRSPPPAPRWGCCSPPPPAACGAPAGPPPGGPRTGKATAVCERASSRRNSIPLCAQNVGRFSFKSRRRCLCRGWLGAAKDGCEARNHRATLKSMADGPWCLQLTGSTSELLNEHGPDAPPLWTSFLTFKRGDNNT